MQVTITHREKTSGILTSTTRFQVVTSVKFSKAEFELINGLNLQKKVVVMKRQPDDHKAEANMADLWTLTLEKLLRGEDVYNLDTPLEARNYEHELKEALVNLKGYIEANAERPSGTQTYEL